MKPRDQLKPKPASISGELAVDERKREPSRQIVKIRRGNADAVTSAPTSAISASCALRLIEP